MRLVCTYLMLNIRSG